MSRYFIKLAYKGTQYAGWQSQPNATTVQGEIEKALSTLLNEKVSIMGCGRTDAGVHASCFYAHMDHIPSRYSINDLTYKLDNILPSDITVYSIRQVEDEAHARFDATHRSYVYKLSMRKDVFSKDLKYKFDQADVLDFELLQHSIQFLVGKHDFYSFCKTHTDVNNYFCEISISKWERITEHEFHYHITANRFLRGMVRLIVGMSLNVAMKRIEHESVLNAFSRKERLRKAWSVPAHGLYLSDIQYPYNV